MQLKVIAIENKGNLDKEVVWLEATEACAIQNYLITDTTYTDDEHISNELRHVFWFPTKNIANGDLIALRTKDGTNTAVANDRKTTTHTYYWKLGRTVWNKDGDCAVLFHLNNWRTTKA